MSFIRKVVLPGVVAAVVGLLSPKPMVAWLITLTACATGDGFCIEVSAQGPVYRPWLATLPIAGALAAALARRTEARPAGRLIAALAPAIYLSVEILVVSVIGPFYWRIPIYWALTPAVGCAIGHCHFSAAVAVRREYSQTRRPLHVPARQQTGLSFRSMEIASLGRS